MRVRTMVLVFLVMLSLSFSTACLAQEQGYFTQMGQALTRGAKNLVSFPWEIPSTIGRYDKSGDNPRVIRDATGFVDGTFRAVTRLGCGLWDVLFAFVPGQQDELPLDPKTLF